MNLHDQRFFSSQNAITGATLVNMSRESHQSGPLRRIVAILLVLSNLGFGTAWAFDWHEPNPSGHAHVVEAEDFGSHLDDDECDHCCHALAHMLGITSDNTLVLPKLNSSQLVEYSSAQVSRATDPPLKPPQS